MNSRKLWEMYVSYTEHTVHSHKKTELSLLNYSSDISVNIPNVAYYLLSQKQSNFGILSV